jgi:hypothetical protein
MMGGAHQATRTLIGHQIPDRHRLHHQRLRGVDHQGRHVPRLFLRPAGRLFRRTDRHEFPRSNHDASLLVIEKLFGWVSPSDAFISALAAR